MRERSCLCKADSHKYRPWMAVNIIAILEDDRLNAIIQGCEHPTRPHQPAPREDLRSELKPYLTQLCKVHATTGGFLSPETNRIGQDIYDKHGHESMVAVCD